MTRILVTGSRGYRGPGMAEAIFDAIHRTGLGDLKVTIVEGGAAGADAAARQAAAVHEFDIETIDAPWDGPCLGPHRLDPLTGQPWCQPGHRKQRRGGGDYCPRAGHRRNQHMVDLGADIALAFPLGASHGTRDCIKRIQAAGIDLVVHDRHVETGAVA